MSEYPWNEKSNTFTWLSSLYNPFKDRPSHDAFFSNKVHLKEKSAKVLGSSNGSCVYKSLSFGTKKCFSMSEINLEH